MRDQLAIFNYNSTYDFRFASGAVGEELAKTHLLDPAANFQPFNVADADTKQQLIKAIEGRRANLMMGFTPELKLDVGGTGFRSTTERYVIDINITDVPEVHIKNEDRAFLLGSAFSLMAGQSDGMHKGFLLPNSVTRIYIDSPQFGGSGNLGRPNEQQRLIDAIKNGLKPDGQLSIFIRDTKVREVPISATNLPRGIAEVKQGLEGSVVLTSIDTNAKKPGDNITGTQFTFRKAQ